MSVELISKIVNYYPYKEYLKVVKNISLISKYYLNIRKYTDIILLIKQNNINNIVKILLHTDDNFFNLHLYNVNYVLYSLICQMQKNNIFGIIFHYDFNCKLSFFPNNLKYLIMGYHFDESIEYLPDSLEYFSVEGLFNKNINKFPTNLKHLLIFSSYSPVYLPNLISLAVAYNEFNGIRKEEPLLSCNIQKLYYCSSNYGIYDCKPLDLTQKKIINIRIGYQKSINVKSDIIENVSYEYFEKDYKCKGIKEITNGYKFHIKRLYECKYIKQLPIYN